MTPNLRLDFVGQTERARQTINSWVADNTEQKIKDLIPAGVLTRDTSLVLTNAVYFHGLWSAPFDQQATEEADFYLGADRTTRVPLMHQQKRFRYAVDDGVQILELPYGEDDLSMVVLLPEAREGLARLESSLSLLNLQKWLKQVSLREVIVHLPRFKTTSQFELSETLASLGMVSAFDPSRADFSGINGKRNLYISAALHKAYVDVNEEGTEAAAATGIVISRSSIAVVPEKPPVFRADHPFVFLIRDRRSDAILFLGRLLDPS